MRKYYLLSLLLFLAMSSIAQVIPDSMRVNWSYAGMQNWVLDTNNVANVKTFGAAGDGVTNDYPAVLSAISSLGGRSGIVFFPAGNYLINSTINLPDSVTLKGEGATMTSLTFNLGGVTGNSINIQRAQSNSFIPVNSGYTKGSYILYMVNPAGFNKGDYAELRENNGAWNIDTASWADYSVGQIVQIDSVAGSAIYINHPLRITYDSSLNVEIQKINPVMNVGIECLRMTRVDSTAPSVNYMVYFDYAVNCMMLGVESDHSIGAHVWAEASTSVNITGCYFHHSYIYNGASTDGYGVAMAVHTGEFKIENNIFQHLRHAMIVKQGANGNVYSYNYATQPTRTEFPTDAGGDIELHGHYAFANLFEGNIVSNAQIDTTWGPSGPYNTLFRNAIQLYGFFITAGVDSSDKENIVGNDITNSALLHGFFYLTGSGDVIYGNNVLGTITPAGTAALPDSTYYLSSKPSFWNISAPWTDIGTPNDTTGETNPARERYISGNNLTLCGNEVVTGTAPSLLQKDVSLVNLYPAFFTNQLTLNFYAPEDETTYIKLYDAEGRVVLQKLSVIKQGLNTLYFDTCYLQSGLYVFNISDNSVTRNFKCIKVIAP